MGRIGRLIVGIGIDFVMMIVAAVVIMPSMDGNGDGAEMLTVVVASIIGLAHQICWDFLSGKWLNNKFGASLKRIIFFIVAVVMGAFGVLFYYTSALPNSSLSKLNFIKKSIVLSSGFVAIASIAVACLSSVQDFDEEKSYLSGAISVGVSLVLGAICALLGEWSYKILPGVVTGGGLIGLGVYMHFNGWIYTPYQEENGGTSYHGGYSGSSSSGSGSSRSSSSYSSSSSSSSSYTDTRKKDGLFLNQFKTDMHSLASGSSKTVSLAYGATLHLSASVSASATNVAFTINYELDVHNITATCESELRTIANERDKEVKEYGQDLIDRAKEIAENLRDEYQDYDKSIRFSARVGSSRLNK